MAGVETTWELHTSHPQLCNIVMYAHLKLGGVQQPRQRYGIAGKFFCYVTITILLYSEYSTEYNSCYFFAVGRHIRLVVKCNCIVGETWVCVCTCVDTRLFYSPPTKSQSMRLGFDRFTFTNQSTSTCMYAMAILFCKQHTFHRCWATDTEQLWIWGRVQPWR